MSENLTIHGIEYYRKTVKCGLCDGSGLQESVTYATLVSIKMSKGLKSIEHLCCEMCDGKGSFSYLRRVDPA